jgi:hypothetical protein
VIATGVTGDLQGHRRDDRVSLTRVIMEAMLAYMYTGEVEDIGNISQELYTPYCGGVWIGGFTTAVQRRAHPIVETVVNMFIHAADHNAPDLKKACTEFIVHNTAAVKQSEGWGKLREDQTHRELWVELLENNVESR